MKRYVGYRWEEAVMPSSSKENGHAAKPHRSPPPSKEAKSEADGTQHVEVHPTPAKRKASPPPVLEGHAPLNLSDSERDYVLAALEDGQAVPMIVMAVDMRK